MWNKNKMILVLVICTKGEYTSQKGVWLENKAEGVDVYFVEHCENVLETTLNDTTLLIPGTESLKNIIVKTVEALKYFLVEGHQFTYVLRTNMSSLWNFKNYLNYLKTLPREKVYCGIVGNYGNLKFVSGAGITFSPDVCNLLMTYKEDLSQYAFVDDVGIAKFLFEKHQIVAQQLGAKRTDLSNEQEIQSYIETGNFNTVYHFRCKFLRNRKNEGHYMQLLLDQIKFKDNLCEQ